VLAVIKHALDAIFSIQQHSALAHSAWCVQHSSAAAVQNFISSSSPDVNSDGCSTRFMETYGITDMSCKSVVLNKSSSNWLNSGKPLTRHLTGAVCLHCFDDVGWVAERASGL